MTELSDVWRWDWCRVGGIDVGLQSTRLVFFILERIEDRESRDSNPIQIHHAGFVYFWYLLSTLADQFQILVKHLECPERRKETHYWAGWLLASDNFVCNLVRESSVHRAEGCYHCGHVFCRTASKNQWLWSFVEILTTTKQMNSANSGLNKKFHTSMMVRQKR